MCESSKDGGERAGSRWWRGVDGVEECEGLRRQATARLTKVASEGGSSAAVRGVDEKAALLLPSTDGRLRDCGGVGCLGRGCCAFGSASPERQTLHMLSVCLLSHSTTRTWASCQGLCVLLSCFRASSGMPEVRRSYIALSNTLTKQTQTLCVSSTRSHTHDARTKALPLTHPYQSASVLSPRPRRLSRPCPRRKGLVSICARDWRLLQLDRYRASMIRPAMTLAVSRANLSAPTPARGLPAPPRP